MLWAKLVFWAAMLAAALLGGIALCAAAFRAGSLAERHRAIAAELRRRAQEKRRAENIAALARERARRSGRVLREPDRSPQALDERREPVARGPKSSRSERFEPISLEDVLFEDVVELDQEGR